MVINDSSALDFKRDMKISVASSTAVRSIAAAISTGRFFARCGACTHTYTDTRALTKFYFHSWSSSSEQATDRGNYENAIQSLSVRRNDRMFGITAEKALEDCKQIEQNI